MKCAVVGLGSMGSKHKKVLETMEDIESIVTVDTRDEISSNYKSVLDMLNSESNIDFAIVATNTINHESTSNELMRNGINVLVEKPIATTLGQAKSMIDCAEKHNVKLAVGHIERFNPAVKMIKDVIGDNNIINCNITRIGPYPIRIMDVGVKLDLSIHDIDLIRFITGQEITEINHNISKVKSTTHEDSATFLCKMTDGTSCTIFNSWLSPFRKRSIEIFTDKNYYDIDLIRLENVKYTLCEGQSFSLDIKSYSGNALQDQLIAFINYIKNGDPHTLCLPREGFRALSYLV